MRLNVSNRQTTQELGLDEGDVQRMTEQLRAWGWSSVADRW
ncbi:hypothetical protein [Azorhizophilus paspali]|uniref:Uncharacterized protein n=1 Tax=Azorhizophilus paspali TaxID=69963 RepID=A0ABV6SPY9_AZOPA